MFMLKCDNVLKFSNGVESKTMTMKCETKATGTLICLKGELVIKVEQMRNSKVVRIGPLRGHLAVTL